MVDMKSEDLVKVEKTLKELHIRTRTFFTHKSRKLSDVVSDIAKKWDSYTDEEKNTVYEMFGFKDVGKTTLIACDLAYKVDNKENK